MGMSLLLLSATAVWADDALVDNDVATAGNQNSVSLTVAPGASVNTGTKIAVKYQGNKNLALGSSVVFDVDAAQTNLPAGYSVGTASGTVPSDWNDSTDAFNTSSSAVSFTAPATAGSYTYTVKYNVTSYTCEAGINPAGSCLSGVGGAFTINVTAESSGGGSGPTDTDGDGIADSSDNCPNDANPLQENADGDTLGDACDSNSFTPAVGTAAADANGNEGDLLSTSGSFTDADGNSTLTLSVPAGTLGSFTNNGDGTWSWSLQTTDDVASASITVTASDGEHTSATDSFSYSAANVAPSLSSLSIGGNSGAACIGGNTVTLSFSWTDPGSDDTFTGSINWGDSPTTEAFSASPVSTSHAYAAGGPYTISVSVDDDDDGSDSDSSAAFSFLYNVSGVLQPVNDTQAQNNPSIFKYGSTVPVKISVTDCNGTPVSGLAPQIKVVKVAGTTPVTGTDETVTSTSGADSGTTMRYSDPLYIYNLATKSLSDATATYRITITGLFATVTTDFGTKAR